MNFFQRLYKAVFPGGQYQTSGYGSGDFIDSYRRVREPSSWELVREIKNTAYACSTLNSTACANYPPTVYIITRHGDEEPQTETRSVTRHEEEWLRSISQKARRAKRISEATWHPLAKLLKSVNPVHNSQDLWELTQLYQETEGNAYWHVQKNFLGVPESIWILPSHRVRPVREIGSQNPVDYFEFQSEIGIQRFEPEEIIWFKYPDPKDPYGRGLSPMRACYENILLGSKYTAYKQSMIDNRGIPGAVLSPQEVIGEDERMRLEAEYNRKFRRGGNGSVMVAEQNMKLEVIQAQMGDMALLAEAGATKEDVANVYGVPIAMLSRETNMANIGASLQQYGRYTLQPRIKRRDEKINERLVPMLDPSGRLFVASPDPTQEDRDFRLKEEDQDIRLGVRVINEVRRERGLPEVGWGNEPYKIPSVQKISSEDGDAPEPEPVMGKGGPGSGPNAGNQNARKFPPGFDPDDDDLGFMADLGEMLEAAAQEADIANEDLNNLFGIAADALAQGNDPAQAMQAAGVPAQQAQKFAGALAKNNKMPDAEKWMKKRGKQLFSAMKKLAKQQQQQQRRMARLFRRAAKQRRRKR